VWQCLGNSTRQRHLYCLQSVVAISYCLLLNVLVIDIANCRTSRRSGRHIIPPLAWWTTERTFIDPYTNSTRIVCDSPVLAAQDQTNKSSSSLTPKASDSCTDGLFKKKLFGICIQPKVLSELSTSLVEKRTDSVGITTYFVCQNVGNSYILCGMFIVHPQL